MEKLEVIGNFIVDLALIGGVVYLASTGKDGWGWLIFILFVKYA